MATRKIVAVFALACYCAHGFPQEPAQKTTIFGDEQLQGEIFENLKDLQVFNDVARAEEYRLPTTTNPIHYNVLWGVDFAATPQAFSGVVEIQLVATAAGVSEIVLHSEDLTLGAVSLAQGTTPVATTFLEQTEFQFLRIQLNTGVLAYDADNPVVYTLTIAFEAPLRDDMYGIYKSWFRNQYNDSVSWMATTQFQATSARKAFPCYDEPSFKATFDIRIRRPSTYNSWSCTRIRNTVASPGMPNYEDDIYHTTPIMSTYLLALIVAEYSSLPVYNDEQELIYEVIARPNAIATNQGQYALEVGQQLLAEMNNHTNYNFYSMNPELKMTQASIPDFSAGAMENWGLLTYREAYIMYDPVHTNSYFKQLIAYILSHEIAHMWFGNLVTCDWWDVLWLNEGFARYYQYFLTDWVETDMGLETRFITEQIHTALLSDSSNNPHPLSNPGVGSPQAVSAMFSTLSYNKGAAVIRMTEHFLGHDVHRLGLRNYLVDNEFKTVLPINLFESLQAAGNAAGALAAYGADFSLVDYYKSWTEQRGHPVLNVHVNHQTGDMTIYQRRFNINTGYSDVTTNWIIPITFYSASNSDFNYTKPTHVISKAVTVINRGSVGDEWVIFNKQQTGYYRVNYDDYTWDLITAALRGPERTQIHDYNRAQIVNDVFQFARSGLLSYTKAFNILSFLEFETSYAPWVAAITGFTWLRNRLIGTPFQEPLEALIADWATTVMADLTYYPTADPEDFMRSYLRYQLAPLMCQLNRDTCRTAAVDQFNALRNDNQEVPADSRNWVYCNALREGGPDVFDFLRTRFIQHNVYTEKILILQILGCTPHATSLDQLLNDIVTPNEIIRSQDYTTAFSAAVNGNEENTQIVFQWIRDNLQNVSNAFNSVATPLSYISARLRTEEEILAFEMWAYQNAANLGDALNSVLAGAQSARSSLQWTTTVTADINNYLDNGYQEIELSTAAPIPEPVDPVLEERPELVEPETPELPSSATASFLSMTLLSLAAVFKFIL